MLLKERLVFPICRRVDKKGHQELLSILLQMTNKQKSVYGTQGLLSSVNSLKELSQLVTHREELQGVCGIGRVKAIELKLAD